jgi:hypothetical protein
MTGIGITVNGTPLLNSPPLVTTTLPLVAPGGTVVVILVSLQIETRAGVPLNVTVELPCELPKFDPAIMTWEPTTPEVRDRLVMRGGRITVNGDPALDTRA